MQNSERLHGSVKGATTNYIYTVRVEHGVPVETKHSETCSTLTGYTPQDFLNNPYLWIEIVIEEDHHIVRQQAEQVLSMHFPQPIIHRIIRKDGAVRWVENSVIPNHGADGQLLSYFGVIRDVTERREMEEQLSTIDNLINQADALLVKNRNNGGTEEVLSLNKTDKRAYKRVSTADSCWAELSDSGRIKLRDVSIGGLCLKTVQHLPVDSWHQIKILSDQDEAITSTAVVIWSNSQGSNGLTHHETGLRFTGMNDRLKGSLGRFIINLTT